MDSLFRSFKGMGVMCPVSNYNEFTTNYNILKKCHETNTFSEDFFNKIDQTNQYYLQAIDFERCEMAKVYLQQSLQVNDDMWLKSVLIIKAYNAINQVIEMESEPETPPSPPKEAPKKKKVVKKVKKAELDEELSE